MLKRKFKLYAMRISAENFEAIREERFSRANAEYILVYTDAEAPQNASMELGEEHIGLLSETDRKWLLDCNMALIAEETEKNMSDIMRAFSDKMDALEEALRKESEEAE